MRAVVRVVNSSASNRREVGGLKNRRLGVWGGTDSRLVCTCAGGIDVSVIVYSGSERQSTDTGHEGFLP
jgi:hypothetical protein